MRRIFSLIALVCTLVSTTYATHLRSGEIRVRQLSPNGLTVEVTVVVYTKTDGTTVLFGGDSDWLDFGDGTMTLVPETRHVQQYQLGRGIGMASYKVTHTYAAPGAYVISYSEPNRNEGVLNMDESVNTVFYIESMITLKPGTIYRTPDFLLPSIHYGIIGSPLSLSLSCMDSTGHQLLYETVTPKRERAMTVTNYKLPENFSINPFNGLVTWDTKFNGAYTIGEYGFAIRVWQYNAEGIAIGYITRDFQVILEDGLASASISDDAGLDENNRIYVPENDSVELKIFFNATDADNVMLTAFSELEDSTTAFHFETYDSTTDQGASLKVGKLSLQNTNDILRDLPYVIAIRGNFEMDGRVLSQDIGYLFYTKDTALVIPMPPPIFVGTEDERSNTFDVYPNPTRDLIFFKDAGDVEFELRDASGAMQQQGTALQNGAADPSHLLPGMYFLVIKGKNKREAVKIIRE